MKLAWKSYRIEITIAALAAFWSMVCAAADDGYFGIAAQKWAHTPALTICVGFGNFCAASHR